MLTLQRNLSDQGVVIVTPDGQELRMYITSVKGKTVKLGFTKFEGFKVWRGELYEKMQREGADKIDF